MGCELSGEGQVVESGDAEHGLVNAVAFRRQSRRIFQFFRRDGACSTRARAIRETREETGVDVEIVGIVGTYTNPRHVFAYNDGEVRQEFSVCFVARPVAGQLTVSEESTDVRWFDPAEVDALPMVPSIRKRVNDWRYGKMPAAR